MTSTQPRINPPTTEAERIYDILTIGLLALMLVALVYYYPQLPEEIPTHFDAKGNPDASGQKATIWLLPAIGLLVSLPMFYLYRVPWMYNYMVKITPENASVEYQHARAMLRMVNLSISLIFCVLVVESCWVGTGQTTGLGAWFLPFVIIVTMLPLVFYLGRRKSKQ